MPDPMQFVTMMGGAPPPPPAVLLGHPPPPPPPIPVPVAVDLEPVLPPGIDAADADQVIKPISDAPLPRKGPLPQDFQDALSIIFPGEKRLEDDGTHAAGAEIDAATTTSGLHAASDAPAIGASCDGTSDLVAGDALASADLASNPEASSHYHSHLQSFETATDAIISAPPISAAEAQEQAAAAAAEAAAIAAMMDEQSSQHSVGIDLYSAFSVVNGVAVLNAELAGIATGADVALSADVMPHHMPLQSVVEATAETDGGSGVAVGLGSGGVVGGFDGAAEFNGVATDSNSRDEELKAARLEELNDMAMLGIDADDLAAQCM